jgi:glycosyltransferase involved in cell wall biosynthesis
MLDITPLVITYNEAPNIGRTLDKLSGWAKRIVVVDSGSTDGTLEIVRACSQVDLFHREFTDFASQCNFGLERIASQWVLSLDADYELSDHLVSELQTLSADEQITGFRARFIYRIHGLSLRGTLYPPRVVLYRKTGGRYRNEGHGHRVEVTGTVLDLKGVIYHDDRKKLSRWFSSQQRYARDEARFLLDQPKTRLTRVDRLRLMAWPAPVLIFAYTLFVKGCVLDGWAGWHYVLQRLCFELILALEIVDNRLSPQFVGSKRLIDKDRNKF